MSLVRKHADQWGIDKGRIGILGFSAGGHLSATASTNYDRRAYEPIDDVDTIPCRPDFTVLVYPAYLCGEGKQASSKLSPEIQVTNDTPPTFFVHAGDDRISPLNSIAMYTALHVCRVPAELHVYASGGHGFGLRPTDHPCCTWPQRCEQWMRSQGLLKSSAP
jgi:acetyl esterase/lipase